MSNIIEPLTINIPVYTSCSTKQIPNQLEVSTAAGFWVLCNRKKYYLPCANNVEKPFGYPDGALSVSTLFQPPRPREGRQTLMQLEHWSAGNSSHLGRERARAHLQQPVTWCGAFSPRRTSLPVVCGPLPISFTPELHN